MGLSQAGVWGRYLDNPETQYLSDVLQKTGYGLLQGITLAGLLLVVFWSKVCVEKQ